MYSVVLMTALSATPDAPQFNGYFRDLFHGGCNGCAGCSGMAAFPAACQGCSGCCGGGFLGFGVADRTRRFFERGNCCGCTGSCFGCMGSGYSCSGYSCSGGLACQGCQGGFPMTFPPPSIETIPGMPSVPGVPSVPFAVPDPAPPMPTIPPPGGFGLQPAAHQSPALVSNGPTGRATVIVKLPTDARLSVDGRGLSLTGAERKFVSPELPVNQQFVYRFKVEYERDGETLSVTKRVPVQAGGTVTVEFTDLTAAKPAQSDKTSGTPTSTAPPAVVPPVTPTQEPPKAAPKSNPEAYASVSPNPGSATSGSATSGSSASGSPKTDSPAGGDRATITVKLPPGATLYVDDRKSPSNEPVRQFTTPPLPAGREFAYLLKAEVVRNGQPETVTQKVPFRAGERVTVDFTSLGK